MIIRELYFYLNNLGKLVNQYNFFKNLKRPNINFEMKSSQFWERRSKTYKNIKFWFLQEQDIKHTMFVNSRGDWLHAQVKFLQSYYSDKSLLKLLREEPVGLPNIVSMKYQTSHNSIHHLYHLAFFEKYSKEKIKNISHIIEYGGGYGNMARLVTKINPNVRYVILDLPRYTELQYVYLVTIFGDSRVHLVDSVNGKEKPGIYLINNYQNKSCKISFEKKSKVLFIATWSLSEVDRISQDYIDKKEYFNSDLVLIAYQKSNQQFRFSERYKNRIKNYKLIYNGETDYVKNNYYSIYKKDV